jgi:circadian clock protein KaiB
LKVIDVLKNPQLAEEDKILATPTLSKILPPPVRRIIGDLSDRERVLIGLDLLYDELVDNDISSSVMDALAVPDIEEADS